MRAQAAAGEIEMAYLDEVGFAQVHPNRCAWTPVGQQHLINAPRGKRLNAVAALLSSGKVLAAKLWENFDSVMFVGFLSLLRQQVDKPVTVVLDNASMHKAQGHSALHQAVGEDGREVVLLASLQSRTQPHRNAVAPDEAQVDGGQVP